MLQYTQFYIRKFECKKDPTKMRDLRITLIQYFLQQNRFGTREDKTIEKEEDVRRYVGSIPLLTDLGLAMRTYPLALIRGVSSDARVS